ncbi:hypothetical protein G6F32_015677 [Rhizopus arrhizus]|nr:hypothetical protein G6F32_015677 [Rhizopus arrhizus]
MQFVQQQAHYAAIAAVFDVLALDQRGSLQHLAQQGCHLYRERFGRQLRREQRVDVQAALVHAGDAVDGVHHAGRHPDRTGRGHHPAAHFRAHHHQPRDGVDQLVAQMLVACDVATGRVVGDPIGDRAMLGDVAPGRRRIDVAGNVLFAIGHDPNAAEGRGGQP